MTRQTLVCMLVWFIASTMWADEFAEKRLQNWHQFRGPLGTGVAPQGNPPTQWSETKNIKWKVPIPGRGSASPIVWGDRIFVLTAIQTDRTKQPAEANTSARAPIQPVAYSSPPLLAQRDGNGRATSEPGGESQRRPDGRPRGPGGNRGPGGGNQFGITAPTNYYQFVVICLDRNTGQTIWRRIAAEAVPHEGHHDTNSYASASPITDGQHLYASFGSRGIFCYDLEGNLIWQKDLGDMQTRFSFGEGASPTLSGDTLVVNWDHEGDSFIIALDAQTGDEKWRQPRDEVSTWATPLVVEAGGRRQVITSGSKRVRSYDLASGELLWQCGGLGSNPIPTPITIDGIVICMTGHQEPAAVAVPLDSKGDVTGTDQLVWQTDDGSTPYIATPVLYDGLLFFTKSRNAILSCIDAKTGQVIIKQKRLPGLDTIYSSPVAAAGRVYFASREGKTAVVKHSRQLELLATNSLEEQTIDATPAIVGNDLLIRGESHLYCISEQ